MSACSSQRDRKTVFRRLKLKAEAAVAMVLGGGDYSAPELFYLGKIQFCGDSELNTQRLGLGHHGIELASDLKDCLAAEVRKGKINQIEVYALRHQAGRCSDAFLLAGCQPKRLSEGLETGPFEKLADSLYPAEFCKILSH
jgi:hypothetical protein